MQTNIGLVCGDGEALLIDKQCDARRTNAMLAAAVDEGPGSGYANLEISKRLSLASSQGKGRRPRSIIHP